MKNKDTQKSDQNGFGKTFWTYLIIFVALSGLNLFGTLMYIKEEMAGPDAWVDFFGRMFIYGIVLLFALIITIFVGLIKTKIKKKAENKEKFSKKFWSNPKMQLITAVIIMILAVMSVIAATIVANIKPMWFYYIDHWYVLFWIHLWTIVLVAIAVLLVIAFIIILVRMNRVNNIKKTIV